MSLNTFLLSKLTNSLCLGNEIPAIVKRYQTLWAIYINLLISLIIVVWTFCSILFGTLAQSTILLLAIPVLIVTFFLLRRNQENLVGILTLTSIHLLSLAAQSVSCLATSHFTILLPALGFLLSSSRSVQIANVFACLFQSASLTHTINERFKVTLTTEQDTEVVIYQRINFVLIGLVCVFAWTQQVIKMTLWQLAQSNYKKTEEIAKEVVQAAKAKDTFVSSLSHEIRNPLNCMNASIDYLLRVIKNPIHTQILNNAKVSGEILLNLLNNVLDAAKLKSDKMEISCIETNSLEPLKKVLMVSSERLKEKQITVGISIGRCLPPIVWIDPGRFLQIMINIFSNSLKFTSERGKIEVFMNWCDEEETRESLLSPIKDTFQHELRKSVTATELKNDSILSTEEDNFELNVLEEFSSGENQLRRNNLQYLISHRIKDLKIFSAEDLQKSERDEKYIHYHVDHKKIMNMVQFIDSQIPPKKECQQIKKGYLKVQISDTGCGIAEENSSKLFEMFGQADDSVGSIDGSGGLGLWLCKQLCQKMGGDITFYSKLNKGTTFVFYFPVNNNLLTALPHLPVPKPLDKLRALVVDDYAYNRDVHKLILEKENVQVHLACNGQEAVDAFTSHPEGYFQVIFMDVKMPVMDGFTAAKKIREWETAQGKKKVDIVIVSGEYYDEEEVMHKLRKESKMIEVTGIRCLKKPIDVEKIRKILMKYNKAMRKDSRPKGERDDSSIEAMEFPPERSTQRKNTY